MADRAEWAVRRFCLECQGGDAPSVTHCADAACLLYAFRPYQEQESAGKDENPARAVRRFCMACAGSRREVRDCDAGKTCALWSFRFGVHPSTFKRVLARRKKVRGVLTLPGL